MAGDALQTNANGRFPACDCILALSSHGGAFRLPAFVAIAGAVLHPCVPLRLETNSTMKQALRESLPRTRG